MGYIGCLDAALECYLWEISDNMTYIWALEGRSRGYC